MLFHTRRKASDIIRKKLVESGGIVTISLLDQKPCTIVVADGGCAFTSDKLNKHRLKFDFSVFDVIIDFTERFPHSIGQEKATLMAKKTKWAMGNVHQTR
ncbi:MAG: hypothetical protein V8R57_01815 [Evtepia sp.]